MSGSRLGLAGALVAIALAAGCGGGSGGGNGNFPRFATAGGPIVDRMTVSVLNNISGQAIDGAVVIDETTGAQALTNGNGLAVLNGLGAGPTTITIGAPGFDLFSIVGLDANSVAVSLNRKNVALNVGRVTVTGNIVGLNAGDVIDVRGSFEHEGTFNFDAVNNVYDLEVDANEQFTIGISRLGAGLFDTDDVLVLQLGPAANNSAIIVDVDFPIALLAQDIFAFGADGQVTIPNELDNGDVTVTSFGRDVAEDPRQLLFGDSRLNTTGLVPTGRNTTNVGVAAGNQTPFNVRFNDPNGVVFESFLLVSATSTSAGAVISSERVDVLPAVLPNNLVLDDPVLPDLPPPNAVAVGLTPVVQVDANGFVDANDGFFTVELRDTVNDDRWTLLVQGGATTFDLPDLAGNGTLANLGLTVGNPVEMTIVGQRFDAVGNFDFDAVNFGNLFGGLAVGDRSVIRYTFTP